MHKKGSFNPVEWAFYLAMIIFVSVFIYFIAIDYLNENIDTLELETQILTKSLITSETCLAYKDENKVYQGTIDLEKLEFSRLKNCFSKNGFGYKVNLKDINNNEIKQVKVLDARQEAFLPICEEFKQYKCIKKTNLVSYKQNNKLELGLLTTEVISIV